MTDTRGDREAAVRMAPGTYAPVRSPAAAPAREYARDRAPALARARQPIGSRPSAVARPAIRAARNTEGPVAGEVSRVR